MNQNIIVTLPYAAEVQPAVSRRYIYFEASRDGEIDRENEEVAADALWKSRELLLAQGDFDINHFAHLGNPYGTDARPEYVVGMPTDVRRKGKSIFCKGEIFSSRTPPPPDSNGEWAEKFWHSIDSLDPAMRWFPSVFGKIKNAEWLERNGQMYRRLTELEWTSVGFALRVQHGGLGAIQKEPLPIFAKAADLTTDTHQKAGVQVLSWGTFAKAVSEGITTAAPVTTDSAALSGFRALVPESLEGATRAKADSRVIKEKILRGEIAPNLKAITAAFKQQCKCSDQEAREYASRFLRRVSRQGSL